jgi:hypothetical protein
MSLSTLADIHGIRVAFQGDYRRSRGPVIGGVGVKGRFEPTKRTNRARGRDRAHGLPLGVSRR